MGRSDAPLVGGLFVLFFARIILKDLRDRLGDARFGKPTLLLRIGKRATCAVSMAGAALGTAVLIAGLELLATIALLLGSCGLGIEWMLLRLARTHDERAEQVTMASPRAPGTDSSLRSWPCSSSGRKERTSVRSSSWSAVSSRLRRVLPGRGDPSGAGGGRLQSLTRGGVR
ncbi:MAG TPA: UbiA family prenyltransferase [Actinomycetota bacterium]|nr:UbiA family prenyltransferase [Actinomycetota bacterium]